MKRGSKDSELDVSISVKVVKRKKNNSKVKLKVINKQVDERKIIEKYIVDPTIRKKLVQLGGENVLHILKHFKSPANDEELASKTKVKINNVRATLNKLHGEGMLTYTKVRDEKTGWYIYSWYFNVKKFEEWVNKNLKEFELEEGKEYYYCPRCKSAPVLFEHAAESNFRCLQCGEMLEYYEREQNA